MVTIVDPHIKRDSSYSIHNEAQSKGFYVKSAKVWRLITVILSPHVLRCLRRSYCLSITL